MKALSLGTLAVVSRAGRLCLNGSYPRFWFKSGLAASDAIAVILAIPKVFFGRLSSHHIQDCTIAE